MLAYLISRPWPPKSDIGQLPNPQLMDNYPNEQVQGSITISHWYNLCSLVLSHKGCPLWIPTLFYVLNVDYMNVGFSWKKKKMWTTGKQNLRMTVLPPHRLISKWEKWHPEKPEQCLNKDLDHFHILLRATLRPWLSPNVGLKWGSWAGRSGTK